MGGKISIYINCCCQNSLLTGNLVTGPYSLTARAPGFFVNIAQRAGGQFFKSVGVRTWRLVRNCFSFCWFSLKHLRGILPLNFGGFIVFLFSLRLFLDIKGIQYWSRNWSPTIFWWLVCFTLLIFLTQYSAINFVNIFVNSYLKRFKTLCNFLKRRSYLL